MYIIFSLICAVLVAADNLTKYMVTANMSVNHSIALVDGVFHLTYVRNTGAAFSMLSGQRIFLILTPIVVIVALLVYIFIKKPSNKLLLSSFCLIGAGGVGNLIDRIRFGYVIDFLDFRLINFPVFNVADIWVTCGAVLFIWILLFSKEEIV